jgi:hypothetical protein
MKGVIFVTMSSGLLMGLSNLLVQENSSTRKLLPHSILFVTDLVDSCTNQQQQIWNGGNIFLTWRVSVNCSMSQLLVQSNFYRQPIASLSLKNINLASKINMDRRDSHTELFDVLASCSIKTKFSRENLLPVLLDH